MDKKYRYKVTTSRGVSYHTTTYSSPVAMNKWKRSFNRYAGTSAKVVKIERKPLVKKSRRIQKSWWF